MNAPELNNICRTCGAALAATLRPEELAPAELRRVYAQWSAVNAGAIGYIDSRLEMICDPFGTRPWARSAVIIAFVAQTDPDSPLLRLPHAMPGHPVGTIAGYAMQEDYHRTGHRILARISSALGGRTEPCVDSAPVPEKEMALAAGLGTLAPSSLLRVHGFGCRMYLGVLFTEQMLPTLRPVPPVAVVPCRECMRCRSVCPNHASGELLTVRRCRSWLACEYRGPLSWEEQQLLGGVLFGCSACSICCPEDANANADTDGNTGGSSDYAVDALAFLQMPSAELRRIIAHTPLAYAGVTQLKRNAAACVGLASAPDVRRTLRKSLQSASPAVAITIANWPT